MGVKTTFFYKKWFFQKKSVQRSLDKGFSLLSPNNSPKVNFLEREVEKKEKDNKKSSGNVVFFCRFVWCTPATCPSLTSPTTGGLPPRTRLPSLRRQQETGLATNSIFYCLLYLQKNSLICPEWNSKQLPRLGLETLRCIFSWRGSLSGPSKLPC